MKSQHASITHKKINNMDILLSGSLCINVLKNWQEQASHPSVYSPGVEYSRILNKRL